MQAPSFFLEDALGEAFLWHIRGTTLQYPTFCVSPSQVSQSHSWLAFLAFGIVDTGQTRMNNEADLASTRVLPGL